MSTTSDKSDSDILRDAPEQLTLLLMRFERDALALGDYMTREEQDRLLDLIANAVRTRLMVDRHWSNVAAQRFARAYRQALVFRLTNPAYFKTPSKLTNA